MVLCTWLLVESDPRHLIWGGAATLAGLALHLPMRWKARPREGGAT